MTPKADTSMKRGGINQKTANLAAIAAAQHTRDIQKARQAAQ
jgi:hypothetical protein